MADLPRWVLVNGTVYHLVYRGRHASIQRYVRASIPPGHEPGKKHNTRAGYDPDRLPAHEVITEEQGREIARTSTAAFLADAKTT